MLAKQLGLSWRQVRKTLRELELDLMVSRIVMRDSRASTSLSSKIESTHSYCCLDYKRMFDVCRLKLYKMKKFLKDELDDKTKIEDYLCSTEDCGRNYTSLEVLDLEVDPRSFEFLCEDCGGALDNGSAFAQSTDEKKKHREKIKEQLLIFDEEFAPLTALLKTVQASGDPPYFGTLQEWAVMQRKMRQARNGEDPLGQASEGFVLEFDDDDDDENAADGNAKPRQVEAKELPPWMRIGYQDTQQQQQQQQQPPPLELAQATSTKRKERDNVAGAGSGSVASESKKQRVEATVSELTSGSNSTVAKDQNPGQALAAEDPGDDDIEWEDI